MKVRYFGVQDSQKLIVDFWSYKPLQQIIEGNPQSIWRLGYALKKLVPIGEGHGRSKVCKSLRCVGMFSLVEKGDSSE